MLKYTGFNLMLFLLDLFLFSTRNVMFKTAALLGTGIAIGCYYQSHKNGADKTKTKNLTKTSKNDKNDDKDIQPQS